MSDVNQVALSGRLTRDPELRHTAGGLAIMNARLAFETGKKTSDGWTNESNFIDLSAFGNRAEFYADRLAKGSLVFVSGRLKWSEWGEGDAKKQKIEVNVDEIKSPDLFNSSPTHGSRDHAADFPGVPVDDDIPF